jgi:hypothetical protein
VGVTLGCRHPGMAKNLLHDADVHALFDKQSGSGVPGIVDPGVADLRLGEDGFPGPPVLGAFDRAAAEDKMAGHLAEEVLRASTDFDGAERAPMRNTEARITLGVIAARHGDIDQAVHYGEKALTESRRSLPSLAMVSRDLARVLKERYPAEQATENYLDQLRIVVGNLARKR